MEINELLIRLAERRQKIGFFFLILICGLALLPWQLVAQERTGTASLPAHELGDQMIGADLGLLLPLFFQDFSGNCEAIEFMKV